MSDDSDSKKFNRSWGWVVALLIGLPLLYVLSIGPVAAYYINIGVHSPPKAWETFYAPLIWLHDNTFMKEPLEWYLTLWGVI